MKRYLLFGGSTFYPRGGWRDFLGAFDDVAAASAAGNEHFPRLHTDWFHVVDTHTMTIVLRAGRQYGMDDDETADPWHDEDDI